MSEAQHFYQAIGELFATLVIADDGTKFLETGQGQYRAFVPLQVEKRYQDKYLGQQVYWRVYPQFSEQGLSFKIVSLAEQPKRGAWAVCSARGLGGGRTASDLAQSGCK